MKAEVYMKLLNETLVQYWNSRNSIKRAEFISWHCLIVNVMIENIKIKTMFDFETEINCMFKWLINVAQLFMCQNINIIMINIINERAYFFNVYEIVSISIDSITISISIFVVKRLNHELLLKRFFQHAVYMSFININDESFEMILHFLNKEKRMNFLKVPAEHISNKKRSMFAMKSLNVQTMIWSMLSFENLNLIVTSHLKQK